MRLAMLHFADELRGKHILVRTDNTAAKSHINKQGGSKSSALHREARKLFLWAERHLRSVRTEHVRGLDNVQVDWLSRSRVDPGEWSLRTEIFNEIVQRFGKPVVDLFASHLNCQIQRFFSQYIHPRAEAMDALTSPWPLGLLYAFPPIPLIPRLLWKIGSAPVGDSGSSVVAPQTVVLDDSPVDSGSTSETARLSRHVTAGAHLTSPSGVSTSDRLAIERRQLLDLGLSVEVVSTLLAS